MHVVALAETFAGVGGRWEVGRRCGQHVVSRDKSSPSVAVTVGVFAVARMSVTELRAAVVVSERCCVHSESAQIGRAHV